MTALLLWFHDMNIHFLEYKCTVYRIITRKCWEQDLPRCGVAVRIMGDKHNPLCFDDLGVEIGRTLFSFAGLWSPIKFPVKYQWPNLLCFCWTKISFRNFFSLPSKSLDRLFLRFCVFFGRSGSTTQRKSQLNYFFIPYFERALEGMRGKSEI